MLPLQRENLFGGMAPQSDGNGYGLAYSMSFRRFLIARKRAEGDSEFTYTLQCKTNLPQSARGCESDLCECSRIVGVM